MDPRLVGMADQKKGSKTDPSDEHEPSTSKTGSMTTMMPATNVRLSDVRKEEEVSMSMSMRRRRSQDEGGGEGGWYRRAEVLRHEAFQAYQDWTCSLHQDHRRPGKVFQAYLKPLCLKG